MTSNAPNAEAAESAVRQVGTEFRRLRGIRGERIEDIAAYLDIKATYLFGIEQGDLSVIPSRREAKSIVRNYASYLGLDGESIIGPMDPIIASLEGENAPPTPKKHDWIDRTSAIILSVSVILGVLVGWSWIGDVDQFDLLTPPVATDEPDTGAVDGSAGGPVDGEATADLGAADRSGAAEDLSEATEDLSGGTADLSGATEDLDGEAAIAADALLQELKTALAEGAPTATGETGSAAAADVDAAAGADASTDAESATEKVEDPANVLAALVAERGDGAHIYEAENTDARVIVRALADVSVQVTSRSSDYVWTRTMKPREMLLVPNRDDLELWTGNAARIELLLDGAILPPLGPDGTVISGLSLATRSLEAIADALPDGGAKPTF
ncbi:MAG: RodZ domain-containing protein [Geminicoccaceae bacterium]